MRFFVTDLLKSHRLSLVEEGTRYYDLLPLWAKQSIQKKFDVVVIGVTQVDIDDIISFKGVPTERIFRCVMDVYALNVLSYVSLFALVLQCSVCDECKIKKIIVDYLTDFHRTPQGGLMTYTYALYLLTLYFLSPSSLRRLYPYQYDPCRNLSRRLEVDL